MKGAPKTAGEWADALEDEAIEEAAEKKDATVDDIRTEHERLICDLFEKRAQANAHTPAIVAGFRREMHEALRRVDALAEDRMHTVEEKQEEHDPLNPDEVLIETVNKEDLVQGKFKSAPKELAA